MMYYTGTIEQLEAYLAEVNAGENYQGTTTKWADILTKHDGSVNAVLAHPHYSSELSTLEELPSDWFPPMDN